MLAMVPYQLYYHTNYITILAMLSYTVPVVACWSHQHISGNDTLVAVRCCLEWCYSHNSILVAVTYWLRWDILAMIFAILRLHAHCARTNNVPAQMLCPHQYCARTNIVQVMQRVGLADFETPQVWHSYNQTLVVMTRYNKALVVILVIIQH